MLSYLEVELLRFMKAYRMYKQREKSAVIAMSGGVDSSVAAYLMTEKGYRCTGITMRLFRNPDIGLSSFHTCCSQKDINDASDVAFTLDIPYEVLDLTEGFREKIIDKFIKTYESGGTPNPCIDCNRYMKFDKLLDYAVRKGFSYIVTGHYARIEYDKDSSRYLLRKAYDEDKDQSYVLYMLTQEQLSKIHFPLGEMKKADVRRIAEQQGFCNSGKHDSQDICFVPDGDYAGFMESYTGRKYPEGDFLDMYGNAIGRHKGAVRYTIGQRKGLGIAAGRPQYVISKDMEENTVVVGAEDHLYHTTLIADDVNWISIPQIEGSLRCKAKHRYRQKEQWANVCALDSGKIKIKFDEPQRAIASGQAVVLYDGDIVLGGGTII